MAGSVATKLWVSPSKVISTALQQCIQTRSRSNGPRSYQARSRLILQGLEKFCSRVEPGDFIGRLSESESESVDGRRSYANTAGLWLMRAVRRQFEQTYRMPHIEGSDTCYCVVAMAVCNQ